jgi:hypothetical protein
LLKVKIIKVTFSPLSFRASDIPKLRGYLSKRFPDYNQIHNHKQNGGFRWVYPEIQFKFIDKLPVIIGHGLGFDILSEVFLKTDRLELSHRIVEIPEKTIQVFEADLGVSDTFHSYRFALPWMALNQKNYLTHKFIDKDDRTIFLNRLLRENLKTLSHAFDYWIPDPDNISVKSELTEKLGQFKGNTMVLFSGRFSVNFKIPQYLGIGKQVARGYGTVVKK